MVLQVAYFGVNVTVISSPQKRIIVLSQTFVVVQRKHDKLFHRIWFVHYYLLLLDPILRVQKNHNSLSVRLAAQFAYYLELVPRSNRSYI